VTEAGTDTTLFIDVARRALSRAGLSAGDIDTVVTVCSTGIATPTLEARVGAPLLATGPYRYLAHPNYAVVVAEIALLPIALHLPWLPLAFTLLNAAVLTIRVRAEPRALVEIGGPRARAAS
jgi:methyltransferase